MHVNRMMMPQKTELIKTTVGDSRLCLVWTNIAQTYSLDSGLPGVYRVCSGTWLSCACLTMAFCLDNMELQLTSTSFTSMIFEVHFLFEDPCLNLVWQVHNIDIAPMIVEFATDEQKDLYIGWHFVHTLWNQSSQWFLQSFPWGRCTHSEADSGWYYKWPRADIVDGGDSCNNTYTIVWELSPAKKIRFPVSFSMMRTLSSTTYDINTDQWQFTN